MNTISTLIPRQNCPNNPVHFNQQDTEFIPQNIVKLMEVQMRHTKNNSQVYKN